MNTESLQARADLAQQVGVKAAAMRKAVFEESLRFEGAIGVLKQALEQNDAELRDNQKAFADKQLEHSEAECARNALVNVHRRLTILAEQAQQGLIAQRGKLIQADETLNMLQALVRIDVAQTDAAIEQAKVVPMAKGKHPGPSIGTTRRATEAQASKA